MSDTKQCACKDRAAADCPGEWEPGCDLGANEKFAAPGPAPSREVKSLSAMVKNLLNQVTEQDEKIFTLTAQLEEAIEAKSHWQALAADQDSTINALKIERQGLLSGIKELVCMSGAPLEGAAIDAAKEAKP